MANFDVELNDEVENFTVEFGEIQRITVDDFDKLRNRPSYAGQTMTHETNIPEVPTTVSQLTNDADYQTGSEVESAISTAVGDEKDAREQADAGLSRDIGVVDGKVDAEADARERADTALQGAIDDEEIARKNADNGLQGQIDAITSSSDVVDIVGTYTELLQYPTAGLGDKDVIKVLQDETHNDAMSYYRWNKSSSTWSYIGSEGPYYTKSETNTLLGDKQDTLTAGSNITISSNNTISATDTTYTAGNGLTLTGTEFSADTTVLQPKLTAGDGINISAQNVISADIDPADFFTASETVDGTGSEMTLNNTIQAKIKSVQMDGDTFQQTYSGKNVFNENDLTYDRANVPANQIQLSALATGIRFDTTYISTTGSPAITFNTGIDLTPLAGKTIRLKANFGEKGEARILRLNDDLLAAETQSLTVSGDTLSWVVPNDLSGSKWLGYGFRIFRPSNEIHTVDFTNVCMTIDNADMNYEPYTGGIPAPNPDYPEPINVVTGVQTVTVTGKNLINSAESHNSINSSGTILSGDQYLGVTNYVPCKPNTDYAVSFQHETSDLNLYVGFKDKDGNFIIRNGYGTLRTFTTPDGATSMFFYMTKTGATPSIGGYAMLEYGSTVSQFEPYQGATYTVDLGATELCKIGDYQDYIYRSGDDWYVHKMLGKTILTGAEAWTEHSTVHNNIHGFRLDIGTIGTNGTGVLADKFRGVSWQSYQHDGDDGRTYGTITTLDNYSTLPYIYLSQPNASISNLSDFKNWLSTHNTTVYYVLATPTDTKITDATLISELDALADALGYKDKTIITVSATGTNLPAILEVSAYRNSLAGVLGVIGRAEAA